MPKASVILRFSNRSKNRARNLTTLLRHLTWNQDIEFIVVAMEKDVLLSGFKPLMQESIPKGRSRVRKVFQPKPFASSVANNIGASYAKSDIIIFQDADILFHPSAYARIINRIGSGEVDAVRVGEQCVQLSEPNTRRIGTLLELGKRDAASGKIASLLKVGGGRDAPGACTAIRRSSFVEIGGWSELFLVYGWEDCYFRYKIRNLRHESLGMPMLHLNHEENYQMKHQPDNNHLYGQILSAKGKQYQDILTRDRLDLLKKYPALGESE